MGDVVLLFRVLVVVLNLLILARVLLSWIDPRSRGQAARFVYRATEPILRPIREILPRTGMIDLSPMVLIVLLTVLAAAVGLR